jgi:hypothetical protein
VVAVVMPAKDHREALDSIDEKAVYMAQFSSMSG